MSGRYVPIVFMRQAGSLIPIVREETTMQRRSSRRAGDMAFHFVPTGEFPFCPCCPFLFGNSLSLYFHSAVCRGSSSAPMADLPTVLGVLLICFMTVIALFGVMYITTSLFICAPVLPLLSSLLRLLIVILLPYRLCGYLLSLLLLLWLLLSVLTSKWRAMSELLQPDGTSPVNLRVRWLNRAMPKSWRVESRSWY